MRNVSANALSAMRTIDYKIVTNDGRTFTVADIISMDIQRKLTDKGLSIGNAISDRFSVTLRKSENDIPVKTRFTVYAKFGNDVNWTMIGKFYVAKCTKNKHGYLNVTCLDFLNILDKECKWKANSRVSALAFPATFQQMLDYIITRYNLVCSFICQNWTQETKPEGYTYRQILGFIAASHAANVQIDEDGEVTFVQFAEASYTLSASNVISQTIDETSGFTVNGLYIEVDDETAIYVDDVSGSTYDEDAVGIVKVKNPFATVAIANYCWTQLGNLSYISTTITKRATTALQCGDVIEVYDYAGEPAQLKAAVTAIHYTVSATGGFQEQITSFADTGENKKTTPNKKAEKKNTVPADFSSDTDPASTASNEVKEGDIWYKVNNSTDKVLVEIRRREIVTPASGTTPAVYRWGLVCVPPSGGGVGEAIGADNTSERFNDYTNNATNQYYDHIEGTDNVVSGAPSSTYGRCHVEGRNNILRNGGMQTVHVEGGWNTVEGMCTCSHIGGNGNTGNVVMYSAVLGASNTANRVQQCLLTGYTNTLSSTESAIMSGENNVASGAGQSLIVGSNNTVTNKQSVGMFGYGNIARWDNSVTCGRYCDNSILGAAYFVVGNGDSNTRSNAFVVYTNGDVVAAGSITPNGADYAECMEWADGNPNSEDRRGMLVMLDADKIIPAHGDDFIGVISSTAAIIGNDPQEWHGKYKKDIFGAVIRDENGNPILSNEYDPNREYIPRSQRPEWGITGLVGRLIVTDNGKCEPNGYISARNGVAVPTHTKTAARVLRRLDKNHVEVLIK